MQTPMMMLQKVMTPVSCVRTGHMMRTETRPQRAKCVRLAIGSRKIERPVSFAIRVQTRASTIVTHKPRARRITMGTMSASASRDFLVRVRGAHLGLSALWDRAMRLDVQLRVLTEYVHLSQFVPPVSSRHESHSVFGRPPMLRVSHLDRGQ